MIFAPICVWLSNGVWFGVEIGVQQLEPLSLVVVVSVSVKYICMLKALVRQNFEKANRANQVPFQNCILCIPNERDSIRFETIYIAQVSITAFASEYQMQYGLPVENRSNFAWQMLVFLGSSLKSIYVYVTKFASFLSWPFTEPKFDLSSYILIKLCFFYVLSVIICC